MAGPIPWPTALLLGGVALGILVAFLSMFCVRWRARRLSRRAAASVREAVTARISCLVSLRYPRELLGTSDLPDMHEPRAVTRRVGTSVRRGIQA